MSAVITALFLLAPGVAQGMIEIGAVEEPVPVRVFPIAGSHDLGRSSTNGFGGGRGHSGQDMFAACGTPVVASQGGKVRKAGSHPVGGNFIVLIEERTGLDAVYMHLANRPRLRARDTVETDQRIGSVGDTGNASAVATCTSSCGRRRAGTPAASRSIRCRDFRGGTRSRR